MAKVSLASLVAATNSEGFLFASAKDVKHLVADELAEVNEGYANPDNDKEFAVRATQKGIDSMNDTNQTEQAPQAVHGDGAFNFVTSPALDKPKRGGAGRSARFPFNEWPAPDADGNTAKIFVAATEKTPEPWKSLTSTISSANRSFAKVTGTKSSKNKNGEEIERNIYEFTRKFRVIEGEHNGERGAWIERYQ